jgi:hypothetical protein
MSFILTRARENQPPPAGIIPTPERDPKLVAEVMAENRERLLGTARAVAAVLSQNEVRK